MEEFYKIRDPIYGFITFDEWEREIINHPVFQRLRRIRQLALTDMVYPGATHTRFEHSLGVMHLATNMYDAITKNDKNLGKLEGILNYKEIGIERNRRLIRLAALLHDIGHAPFSHAGEEIMPKKEGDVSYKHEDYTTHIILNELKDVIEDHNINKSNYKITAKDIVILLSGKSDDINNVFWFPLLSSQLDADRSDYLLRDSYYAGVKYGIYDIQRLLATLSIGMDAETKENEILIVIDESGWHVAESIVIARYQMFSQVYFHKTRNAFDKILEFALKDCLENRTLPEPENTQEYLDFDDFKCWQMFKDKVSQSEWCEFIVNRNPLRVVAETKEFYGEQNNNFEEKARKLENAGIFFWKDEANRGKDWYKLDEEIFILNKNDKTEPLSEYSVIAKNLGKSNQKRIYVKPEDKEKAEKLLLY
jgi:hypothetical protein